MGRVLQPFEYFEPASLNEAREFAAVPGSRYMAGGCELVLKMRRGEVRPARIINLLKIKDLKEFKCHPKFGLEAGAQITLRALLNDIWVAKRWAALHEAIAQIQPQHIANMGTLVGNICSATPYYDVPVTLVALRAEICLFGASGERKAKIEDFYPKPGKTAMEPSEIATSIFAPPPDPDAGSAFRKIFITRRRHDDQPKISAASYVVLDTSKDIVKDATVVIGSWGFCPLRTKAAEKALIGAPATTKTYARAADIAVEAMTPVTDVKWVEEVRADLARVLVRDVLEQAASRARSRYDPAEDVDTIGA